MAGRKTKCTPDVVRAILELHSSGAFNPDIAKQMELAPKTIRKVLKSNGLSTNRRPRETYVTDVELPEPYDYSKPVEIYYDPHLCKEVKKFQSGFAFGAFAIWRKL